MKSRTVLLKLPTMIIVLVLALVCALYVAADDRRCAGCNKPISNSPWVEVEGRFYHPDHFVCANCQKPIGRKRYFSHEDKYYDSVCFANTIAPKCSYCFRPIMTEWVGDSAAVYHTTCFYEHVAKRCVVCNRPIKGKYWFDDFDNFVCEEHQDEVEACFSCGRYLTADPDRPFTRRPDGRPSCFQCSQTAVSDLEQAKSVLAEVRGRLEAKGIGIMGRVGLRLVSQNVLDAHELDYVSDPLGFTACTTRTHFPGVISQKSCNVEILHGLPLGQYRCIAAHELMHVWLYQNGPADLDDTLAEGSCDYASYLLLLDDHSDEGRRLTRGLLAKTNPVYSEGLRRVIEMVDRLGVSGWLDYLKNNTRLPAQD